MAIDTNSLYQMIQDNATQAEGIKTAALNAPTFENQFGTTLKEQDKTLSGAIGAYGDKVAELFAHDKYVADNWSQSSVPTNLQPEGFIEDPYAKSKASANLYAQKGAEVGASLKNLETRKAVLGDLVDKAMKLYDSAVKGKQMDYEINKEKFASALDLLKFEEDKSNKAKDFALRAAELGAKAGAGATGVPEVDSKTDAKIQSEFISRYGANAYSKLGGTNGDRIIAARTLLSQVYSGDSFNPRDLMSDKETVAYDAADALLGKIDYAINKFVGKSGAGGTGPLVQAVPDWASTQNIRELRGAISTITPEKIKEISGVAVSDKEFERLKDQLPQPYLPEEENLRRLNEMKNIIAIGQQMKTRALMENITLNKAYDKYAKDAYAALGLSYQGSGSSSSSKGEWE